MQTQVADVHLHFLGLSLRALSAELLLYLEETLFDLSLYARLELLLHVVKLKVLSFEIFQWIALILTVTGFHVFIDRLLVEPAARIYCAVSLCLFLYRTQVR